MKRFIVIMFIALCAGFVAIQLSIAQNPSVAVRPFPESIQQGVSITQSSPTTGSVTGPIAYNTIDVNVQNSVTSSGLNPFNTRTSRALSITMTEGGPNFNQLPEALAVRLNHTVGPTTGDTDHIAAFITAYSNQTGDGGLAPLDVACYMDAGSALLGCAVIEAEAIVKTGAIVGHRVGIRLNGGGEVQGSSHDSAITTVTGGPAPWKNLVGFGEAGPAQTIDANGNLFFAYQPFTVANIFNLPNVTVTGNIANFQNYKVSGAGRIDATSLYLNGAQVLPSAGGNGETAWMSYTPTITCSSGGSLTTLGVVTGRWQYTGSTQQTVRVHIAVPIVTNGSCNSGVSATLPFTGAAEQQALYGAEMQINAKMLRGVIEAPYAAVGIRNYDNSYPGASGAKLVVQGEYRKN